MPKEKSTINSVKNTAPTGLKNTDIIKYYEQLRLTAYMPTPNDRWTIGWGNTKHARPGMTITEAQAEEWFKEDLAWVESTIRSTVTVPLTQNQYDALGSLIFNIGTGNFAKSTLLKKLNAKDYSGAADQFSVWNKQRNQKTGQLEVLRGLTTRRAKERELFLK